MAAKIAMTTTTINNSTIVKPVCRARPFIGLSIANKTAPSNLRGGHEMEQMNKLVVYTKLNTLEAADHHVFAGKSNGFLKEFTHCL